MQFQSQNSFVKVVPELLYVAMTDSLRQQFYPNVCISTRDNEASAIIYIIFWDR